METYIYKKINAFTSPTSLGNPAACLYLEKSQILPEEVMLSIAREHKGFVSEVVYCKQLAPGLYNLRYFSAECEVAFCGHGTIACMYDLIKNDRTLALIPEVTIQTAKGELVVYNEMKALDSVFITAPDKKEYVLAVSVEDIGLHLGIAPQSIDKNFAINCIDAGLKTLIVPITDLQTIAAMHPDEAKLKTFCLENDIDIILVFTQEVVSPNNRIRTRVFAPKFGYLEDMATGSGNSALGHYMLTNGMWFGEAISIEQNKELTAYNVVILIAKNGKVLFGGRATTKIEGQYLM